MEVFGEGTFRAFSLNRQTMIPFYYNSGSEEEMSCEDCLGSEGEEAATILPALAAYLDVDNDDSNSICSTQYEPLSEIGDVDCKQFTNFLTIMNINYPHN